MQIQADVDSFNDLWHLNWTSETHAMVVCLDLYSLFESILIYLFRVICLYIPFGLTRMVLQGFG